MFIHVDSEDWVFAGHTCHFVGIVMRQIKWNLLKSGLSLWHQLFEFFATGVDPSFSVQFDEDVA